MKIEGFRTDLDDYFGVFRAGMKMRATTNAAVRTPYIVLLENEARSVCYPTEIMKLPPETPVLHAWPGEYRTDVFALTAGDLQRFYAERAA